MILPIEAATILPIEAAMILPIDLNRQNDVGSGCHQQNGCRLGVPALLARNSHRCRLET